LLVKVGKLILLPQDEDPLVATIQDVEALVKDAPFYSDAKNGDKLIVYKQKAIIYDPVSNRLVNVGPVFIQAAPSSDESTEGIQDEQKIQQEEETELESEPISLDIRNGSRTAGKAATLRDELNSKDIYDVVNVANASNNDYQGDILVNLTGKDVSGLEQELGITAVTSLPEGETTTQADIVIIIGNQ